MLIFQWLAQAQESVPRAASTAEVSALAHLFLLYLGLQLSVFQRILHRSSHISPSCGL